MSTVTILLLVGGLLAIILLVVGIVMSRSESSGLVDERLKKYLDEEKPLEDDRVAKARLTDWVNKRVEKC